MFKNTLKYQNLFAHKQIQHYVRTDYKQLDNDMVNIPVIEKLKLQNPVTQPKRVLYELRIFHFLLINGGLRGSCGLNPKTT